jgi:hypothetical protein
LITYMENRRSSQHGFDNPLLFLDGIESSFLVQFVQQRRLKRQRLLEFSTIVKLEIFGVEALALCLVSEASGSTRDWY